MKIPIVISLLFFSLMSLAENPREVPEYTHQGSLISLRIVPKDRKAKIFLVGQKAAEMDLNKDAKILSVTLMTKGQNEVLKLDQQGEFYEVEGIPEKGESYQLMIKTRVRGKAENMKVNIPPSKP